MSQPSPPLGLRPMSLADIAAAEEAQVTAGSDGCGYYCKCHGKYTCARLVHPHDPTAGMGDDKPPGNVVPHVGRDDEGNWVQWVCTDPAMQAMTDADHEQVAVQARAEHTRALLATLDPAVLRAFITEASR